jgi:enolase-phosphatase E1
VSRTFGPSPLTEPPPSGVRAVLLDVEGTTTPLSFVKDVLFPYAKARLGAMDLAENDPDVADLRREYEADAAPGKPSWGRGEPPRAYLAFLMGEDRKSTALKALQGRIWEEGYRRGELRGQVFEDVPRALERWAAQGRTAAIFSSGSVLAQELLFASTVAGDLRRHLRGYFDTRTGPKTERGSYVAIAWALGLAPGAILFLSDLGRELAAAREAGMEVRLCERSGPSEDHGRFPAVTTLDGLYP